MATAEAEAGGRQAEAGLVMIRFLSGQDQIYEKMPTDTR